LSWPTRPIREKKRRISVLPSVTIAATRLADGSELSLVRRGDEWSVRVGSVVLMSSRTHASEEALAKQALASTLAPRAVLIGGLGLGFTLRAVLDRVPATATVHVCELVHAVVSWNEAFVGGLAGHPLADPRARLSVEDVFDRIERSTSEFDTILLDVDNGPSALSQADNRRLYSVSGLELCLRALRPLGVLAVWSAGPDTRFEHRLRSAGFRVDVLRVLAFRSGRSRHVLFVATAPGSGRRQG
jgi:spermidine synthase